MSSPPAAPHRDIPRQAREVIIWLSAELRANLLAVYLYGSFVEGGLRAQSDIDLLALLRHPLSEAERGRVMRELLGFSAYPAEGELRPLEATFLVLSDVLPWRHPARRELQFGEWLRAEVEAGMVPAVELDPDIALLLPQVRDKGIALYGPAATDLLPVVPESDIRSAILAMMPEVARNWRGDEKNALLTLARMWVTLQTGDMVAKDVAVARVRGQVPAIHHPVLQHAVAVYRGEGADDWSQWQDRVGTCVHYMASAITARV
jgi:predicted nucleotidyltransferase